MVQVIPAGFSRVVGSQRKYGHRLRIPGLQVKHAAHTGIVENKGTPWTVEEMQGAYHPSDLMGSVRTVLDVAMFRKGVGGDDSWGAPVLPQYCYPADKPYSFTFTMKAL